MKRYIVNRIQSATFSS